MFALVFAGTDVSVHLNDVHYWVVSWCIAMRCWESLLIFYGFLPRFFMIF